MLKSKNVKNFIYKTVEKILPDKVFDFLWSKYYIWSVKRNSTEGSNRAYYVRNKSGLKEPNYCIFRFSYRRGLFSVANQMLFCCEWAMKNNYIPLVNMEFPDVSMKGSYGHNDAWVWEACFQQPESLNEVFDKGNVLISDFNSGDIYTGLHSIFKEINGDSHDYAAHAQMQNYREYYAKLNKLSQKAWVFQPEIKSRIEKTCKELFRPGMTVLGVVLREPFGIDENKMTELLKSSFKNHPKALSLEETYKYVEEYMLRWNCTHVLITTIYSDSLEYFIDKMGDKVIFVDREREVFDDENILKSQEASMLGDWEKYREINGQKNTPQARERRTKDYAVEMAAIAKCDYCMGVKCSGLTGACILNGGKFKDLYIFEDKNNIQNY